MTVTNLIDETLIYQVPVHWLPALINDDFSGLTDEDCKQLESFTVSEIGGMRRENYQFLTYEVIWSNPFFTKYHDGHHFGCLACDCLEVYAHFQKVG